MKTTVCVSLRGVGVFFEFLKRDKSAGFEYAKCSVFGNIILAEEINRAPAKTQAALFELM